MQRKRRASGGSACCPLHPRTEATIVESAGWGGHLRFKIGRGKFDEPFASINDAPEFMASRRGNTLVGELDPRVDNLASPIGDAFGY